MTVDDLLALEHSEKFDFTDECACDDYKRISNPVAKYCIYKAANETGWAKGDDRKYPARMVNYKAVKYPEGAEAYATNKYEGKTCTAGVVYPEGMCVSEFVKERFGIINDPDSNSSLLQEIYEALWEEIYLRPCRVGKHLVVKSDTMNSAQTTLNQTMERVGIRTGCSPRGNASTKRLIQFYAQEGDNLSNEFETIAGLSAFLSSYHTLGNFIPTPFNSERTARTKDYWDLTLRRIYKWYCAKSEEDKNDELHNLLLDKEQVVEKSKQWLLAFGTWDNFVELNYLQDFVNVNDNKTYGAPKELWGDHFSKALLPENEEDITQFYINASKWIFDRGTRMIAALKEKLSK